MKRILSLLLALIMITGTVPVGSVTAWAADTLPAEEPTAATEPAATDPSEPIVTEPVSAEPEPTAPKEESPIAEKENQATVTLPAPEYLASSGTCGDNLTWTLDDTGTLTISGTGAMEDYTSSSSVPWYGIRKSITDAVIEAGVTSIGQYAFDCCTNLTAVTIPDSVTSIGADAFRMCAGLASVKITDLVAWCTIDFRSSKANPLYNAGRLYLDGTLITNITIPDSITTIKAHAFYGYTGLTSVTIPDSVTSIRGYAFYGCTGLTSVTIPDSVTTIGTDTFENTAWYDNQPDGLVYAAKVAYKYKGTCPSRVTIKDGTLSIAGGAFKNCTGLISIDIPTSVTSIGGYAFYGCIGLTSVTIPDSIISIGVSAFQGCTGLTSVTIPNSVTTIEAWAFWQCANLSSINIGDSLTVIGTNAFYETAWYNNQPYGLVYAGKVAYEYKGGIRPSEVTIKEGTLGIAASAFDNCTDITSVTIPDSVTSIGDQAFYYCTRLKEIYFDGSAPILGNYGVFYNVTATAYYHPDETWTEDVMQKYGYGGNITWVAVDTESETEMSGFCGDNLTWSLDNAGTLTISGTGNMYNYPNLYGYESPWADYASLVNKIVIEDGATSIGEGAFDDCINLTNVEIPESVTDIGNSAFYGCEKLTDIKIPDTITYVGYDAFYNTGWFHAQPDGIVYVGKVAYTCKPQRDACPASLTIAEGTLSIAEYAFSGCTGLTSIEIPASVTYIGSYAFEWTGLISVSIPNSVTYIGYSAFVLCSNLTEIHFYGSAPYNSFLVFDCVTATAYYYPDETWTEEVMQDYGGDITWVPMCREHNYGDWEKVDDKDHKRICTVCKTHSETAEHTFGEDHICTGCDFKAYTVGDFTGDDKVTDADVIYLLWYTVFPQDYPITSEADFTGDDKVTDADVIYLLWHTVFPEDYPIKK